MKNKNSKIIFKKILFICITVYVIYTFLVQQKALNSYKLDQQRYIEQIAQEEEKNKELIATKSNINSEQYIEKIAREKLDMYLPNEKVYIDISK